MNTQRKRVVQMAHNLDNKVDTCLRLRAEIKGLKEQLSKVEDEIVAMMGRLPSEGTTHKQVGAYKVTVATRLNRRLKEDKVANVIEQLPHEVSRRLLPVKHSLSVRELKFLEKNDHDLYRLARTLFTATAGKPTLKIETEDK